MTTTTTTLALSGRTRIPTTRPNDPCRYCASTPTSVGELLPDGWGSVCDTCAASRLAQVTALARTAQSLAASCAPANAALIAAAITDDLKADMRRVLSGDNGPAPMTVSRLLAVVSTARRLALADSDPMVRRLADLVSNSALLPDDWSRSFVADMQRRYTGTLSEKQQAKVEQYEAHVQRRLAAAADGGTPASDTPLCGRGADRCMPNKIARKCCVCSERVAVGAGWSTLTDGLWATYCATCADSTADDRQALVEALRTFGADFIAATGSDTRDHSVRLCVPSDVVGMTGNDLVWLRLCWGASPCVEQHTGGVGMVAVRPISAAKALPIVGHVSFLSADELATAQADYGRRMHRCGRCGSPLTDETSRRIGLGPECAKM